MVEGFLGLGQHGLEVAGRQPVGQGAERLRRLVEPQAGDQFRHLRRLLHPGRLPGHAGDQVRLLPQPGRQRACQPFRLLGLRRPNGDDEFPGVGKMLLVELQALHRRLVGRQQVEHLDINAHPPPADRGRHGQQRATTSV